VEAPKGPEATSKARRPTIPAWRSLAGATGALYAVRGPRLPRHVASLQHTSIIDKLIHNYVDNNIPIIYTYAYVINNYRTRKCHAIGII